MGREILKKKSKKGLSLQDYQKNLQKIKKLLESAQTLEEFEALKISLIKLFEAAKSNPKLREMEPFRITLFKTCNLNIQFLNIENDVWQMFSNGNADGAYELILKAVGTMNTHPDREFLHDWVKNKIQNSLEKIADIVSNQKKSPESPASAPVNTGPSSNSINPLAKIGEKNQPPANSDLNTVVNQDALAPTSFSSSDSSSATVFPGVTGPNAVKLSRTGSASERTRRLRSDDDFETMFKPGNFSEQNIDRNASSPFPLKDKTTEDNPIHTYWIQNKNIKKNLEEKSEFPPQENSE